jgi:glycosyltransferase involved in cell wall biosynthesis
MKIAYITAGAAGMYCGNCLRDNALAAALLKLGHDVQLIPLYTPLRTDEESVASDTVFYGGINAYLQMKSPFFRKRRPVIDWMLDHPALLRFVSKFAIKTEPDELGAMTVSVLRGAAGPQAKELRKLIDWLKADPPQLVYLTNTMLASIAPFVHKEVGVPVCCALQGEDYFLSNLPPAYRTEAFALLREMCHSIDLFISPSQDHALGMSEIVGVPAEKIPVVLPGINFEGYSPRPASNPGKFVIGYLARVSPEKGLHVLAEAVHLLHERRAGTSPEIRLRVAGWLGPEHKEYLAHIKSDFVRWGMEDRFEYIGSPDRAEKIEFLRSLEVLSVPALYRAPKGQYVLEAWACGVPVVQPRIGIFPELLAETAGGALFDAGDSASLAEVLEEFITNRELGAAMGAEGRRAVVERFHVTRMAEETVEVFQSLI